MKFKVFLAASLILASTTVFVSAEETSSVDVGAVTGENNPAVSGSIVEEYTADSQTAMLVVNPGDSINIAVTGAQDNVTLLSYKVNSSSPASGNIQYVNQYIVDESWDGQITYIVREIVDDNDNVEDGLYCLKLNCGDGVKTLYYKVGSPELAESVSGIANATYYTRVDFTDNNYTDDTIVAGAYDGTTSVSYKATFSPNGDAVTQYGFKVSYGEKSSTVMNNTNEKALTQITGTGDYEFGITVYNIKADTNETIESVLNNITATPIINYTDGTEE